MIFVFVCSTTAYPCPAADSLPTAYSLPTPCLHPPPGSRLPLGCRPPLACNHHSTFIRRLSLIPIRHWPLAAFSRVHKPQCSETSAALLWPDKGERARRQSTNVYSLETSDSSTSTAFLGHRSVPQPYPMTSGHLSLAGQAGRLGLETFLMVSPKSCGGGNAPDGPTGRNKQCVPLSTKII